MREMGIAATRQLAKRQLTWLRKGKSIKWFENDKIESEELTVNWQGLPITLDINGSKKSKRYDTNIKLQADWKNDLWLAHIPTKLKKYFEGFMLD